MRGHEYHLHLIPQKKGAIKDVYTAIALRSFATSLIGIFIPIYIFGVTNNLVPPLIFFIFYDIAHAFAAWSCFSLIFHTVGIKRTLTISFICTAIFFLILIISKSELDNLFWLTCIGLFGGFSNGLFWSSYHYTFVLSGHEHKREKEVSQAYLAVQAANTLAPFAGGLLIGILGYNAVFLFAQFLLILGAIAFLTSKDWKEPKHNHKIIGMNKREKMTFLFNGFQNYLFTVFWPLFAFLFIFRIVESLGLLSTFSRFISMVGTTVIGKAKDEESKNILTKAAVVNSGAWLGKAFILQPIAVFLVHALQNLAQVGICITIDTISYSRALAKTPAWYIVEREILIHLGSMVLGIFSLALYFILKDIVFTIIFVTGAITSFGYLLI